MNYPHYLSSRFWTDEDDDIIKTPRKGWKRNWQVLDYAEEDAWVFMRLAMMAGTPAEKIMLIEMQESNNGLEM